MGDLAVAAGADGGDDAVEGFICTIVDDPAATVVLGDARGLGVEARARVEAVALPELAYLADDLLAVGVAACPADRRVEAVHERVDLEA